MKKIPELLLTGAVILLAAAAGCSNTLGVQPSAEMRLVLSLQTEHIRTVLPAPVTTTDIAHYALKLTREGYTDIEQSINTSTDPVEIEKIAVGEWLLQIEAFLEGQNTPSFRGIKTVTINPGTNFAHLTLLPLQEATGAVDVVIEWPSQLVDAVEVFWAESVIDTPGTPMDTTDYLFESEAADTPGSGRLTIQLFDQPSGAYIATVRLFKDAVTVADVTEVVRIYDYQTSQAYIQLESQQLGQAPAAPTEFQAVPARDKEFNLLGTQLSWQGMSSTETGFRIYRSLDGGGTWAELHDTDSPNIKSFSDKLIDVTINTGSTIDYRVESYNSFGSSEQTQSSQLAFYTLTLDGNGSVSPATTITAAAGEAVLLPGNIFARGVYFFDGWSELAAAEVQDYAPEGTFPMPAAHTSLYAFWTVPLLIPDTDNQRIVLMRDMTGADRHVITATQLTDWEETVPFYPTDVEIDARGRMYAAVSSSRNEPIGEMGELVEYFDSSIIRIPDPDSTTHEVLFTSIYTDLSTSAIHAFAMDPTGENLYFADVDTNTESSYLHRQPTTDDGVTTSIQLDATAGLYDPPRGFAYAESGDSIFVFATDRYSLYRFDVTMFQDNPAASSIAPEDIMLTNEYMLGDLAWINSTLQVIAQPNIMEMQAHLIHPRVLTLDIDMNLLSAVGIKGDPDQAKSYFLFPQRFFAVYKQQHIHVTDGGGKEAESLTETESLHPANLIRLRHESDTVQEWETYSEANDPFGFEGYLFVIANS